MATTSAVTQEMSDAKVAEMQQKLTEAGVPFEMIRRGRVIVIDRSITNEQRAAAEALGFVFNVAGYARWDGPVVQEAVEQSTEPAKIWD